MNKICSLLWLVVAGCSTVVVAQQENWYLDERRFLNSVEASMKQVKALLDTTRNPQLLSSDNAAEHEWNDKFSVAEFVTNMNLAATWNVLEKLLSLDDDKDATLRTLQKWVHQDKKNAILRFEAQYSFVFDKQAIQDVDLGKTKDEGFFEGITRNKVVTRRTEYHWKAEIDYKLIACRGLCKDENETESPDTLTLVDRKRTATIITLSKDINMKERTIYPPGELNLTWLLSKIEPGSRNFNFRIDREKDSCRTPSRNDDIRGSQRFAAEVEQWTRHIVDFFYHRVQYQIVARHSPAKPEQKPSLSEARDKGQQIFNPILPLLENSTVLTEETASLILEEHLRSLTGKVQADLLELFAESESADNLISADEAYVRALLHHLSDLSSRYTDSIVYIENELREQLLQAIGKHLTSTDFDNFMRYYYQKLFHPDFAPKPFSQAIRRPGHYPDGLLSIEDGSNEPVVSLERRITGDASAPFEIPINAATSVEITGDRFLHGWMQHRFQNSYEPVYLATRARQFSSFLVLIGTIAGPNKFLPKSAIVLQNKDEVLIPLLTEVLPSAKEFKDAIASLSPEQQEFAKAFRGMQLASSVFGVCVIQLKPQLEKLLALPDGALTKEIQLTQDLLSLFVDYQIPPDLLSFDGPSTVESSEKLTAVKGHVNAVLDMIGSIKKQQLEEKTKMAEMTEQRFRENGRQLHASASLSASPSASPSAGPTAGPSVSYRARSAMSAQTVMSEEAEMLDLDEAATSDSGQDQSYPEKKQNKMESSVASDTSSSTDFTMIPKMLDQKLEEHDTSGAVKSVILSANPSWTRKRQENLLSAMRVETLRSSQLESESKSSLDLLDAISRSGSLPIDAAELHVVIAVAHCFDKSIIETVIQDNENPIASVEKSLLLLASTVFDGTADEIFLEGTDARQRLEAALPSYFDSPAIKIDDASTPSDGSRGAAASSTFDASGQEEFADSDVSDATAEM